MFKLFPSKDDAYNEYDIKQIVNLLKAAQEINKNSKQREICRLISKVLDYKGFAPTMYQTTLYKLHKLLSECLESIYNKSNYESFDKLHKYARAEAENLRRSI